VNKENEIWTEQEMPVKTQIRQKIKQTVCQWYW